MNTQGDAVPTGSGNDPESPPAAAELGGIVEEVLGIDAVSHLRDSVVARMLSRSRTPYLPPHLGVPDAVREYLLDLADKDYATAINAAERSAAASWRQRILDAPDETLWSDYVAQYGSRAHFRPIVQSIADLPEFERRANLQPFPFRARRATPGAAIARIYNHPTLEVR